MRNILNVGIIGCGKHADSFHIPSFLRLKNKYRIIGFYDLNKNPLIKEWVDSSGEVINREILQYDENKKLIRKYYTAIDQQIDSVKYFGENEPWSIEFRKALKENSRNYFQNQQTLFKLNPSNQFEFIEFMTVQGNTYGKIEFIYNHI